MSYPSSSKSGASTPVTTLLLDKIEIVVYAKQHHPFRILSARVMRNSRWKTDCMIKFKHQPETPRSPVTEIVTLLYCLGQFPRTRELLLIQASGVRCRAQCGMQPSRDGVEILTTVPRVLLSIGRCFTDAWRWKQVRDWWLAVYSHSQDNTEKEGHPLGASPRRYFALRSCVRGPASVPASIGFRGRMV